MSARTARMAKILIAENELALREFIARGLAQRGYDVAMAQDGSDAVDLLKKQKFDLLLTDIDMPIMDGIALALAAARDHPGLGILLMTGYADQRERASGLDALIHDVVPKPFSLGTIRNAVNAALVATAAQAR
jgi:two-component system cell cycle response regulator CpdR